MTKRRVVVTGIGCVTASGVGHEECWQNWLKGQSMITEIDAFDTADFPVKLAGSVRNLNFSPSIPMRILQQTDRHTHLALVAAHLGLVDANLDLTTVDRHRAGCTIGNNLGGSVFGEEQLQRLHTEGARGVSPFQSIAWFYAATIGQMSIKYGLRGYSKTYVADRAGSLFALGDALRAIQRGDLDVCLAGGCEAPISPYAVAGYIDADVLSRGSQQAEERYAPFDVRRNGLILGEGGAILILEELEHARRRNARIYAEVCGFGQSCDGAHYQLSSPDGLQYARAMTMALHDGEAEPGSVGYISVDGSAGRCEDVREARAIRAVLGDVDDGCHVSCPKTMFGHLFGGASAVDTAIACLALYHRYIPPTAHVQDVDRSCMLPLVTQEAVRMRNSHALVLATARGGINAALVAKNW